MSNGPQDRLIRRSDLVEALLRWQSGEWTAERVHAWAQEVYCPGSVEFDDWEGPEGHENSVAKEVLAHLDMLDMNLTIVDDVPCYLRFLSTPAGKFHDGVRQFEGELSQIDLPGRQRLLARNPLYAPFCRPAS